MSADYVVLWLLKSSTRLRLDGINALQTLDAPVVLLAQPHRDVIIFLIHIQMITDLLSQHIPDHSRNSNNHFFPHNNTTKHNKTQQQKTYQQ